MRVTCARLADTRTDTRVSSALAASVGFSECIMDVRSNVGLTNEASEYGRAFLLRDKEGAQREEEEDESSIKRLYVART